MDANFFQTASKQTSVRKRKANKARFCVKGHILSLLGKRGVMRVNKFSYVVLSGLTWQVKNT